MAKLYFIGAGQMAEAIIRALLERQQLTAEEIALFDVDPERGQFLQKAYQVTSVSSLEAGLQNAQQIVIAVRPQDDLTSIAKAIQQHAPHHAQIISIVAGVTLDKLEKLVGAERAISRIIPNTLTDTGLGYSGVSFNVHADSVQVDAFVNGFSKSLHLPEKLIDVFTGTGVCGPNYIYYFIESLVDACVLAGLPRKLAWQVTLENMLGSVEMLKKSGLHPRQLLDINNSPAGVGMHGLYELNNSDFAAGLQRSVKAAVKRTTELGQE